MNHVQKDEVGSFVDMPSDFVYGLYAPYQRVL